MSNDIDIEITLYRRGGFLWLQRIPVTYVGNGTVWHEKETGRRAGTMTESQLSDIEWKRTYDAKGLGSR